MKNEYVHGYSGREAERLVDQANAVTGRLHRETRYPAGARVLEGREGERQMVKKPVALTSAALVIAVLTPSVGSSQTRCSRDVFGNTVCRDAAGNTWRGSQDGLGNEVWRDNNGNTLRGGTDVFGNEVWRDSSGNTIRGSIDVFGN